MHTTYLIHEPFIVPQKGLNYNLKSSITSVFGPTSDLFRSKCLIRLQSGDWQIFKVDSFYSNTA